MKRGQHSTWFSHRSVRLVSYCLAGLAVLFLGTYGLWRVLKLFSPETNYGNAQTTLILRSSDHSTANGQASPLPNSQSDQTIPDYSQTTLTPTNLPSNNGVISLPRFQGEIEYQ